MKSYEQLIKEIDKEVVRQKSMEKVVNKYNFHKRVGIILICSIFLAPLGFLIYIFGMINEGNNGLGCFVPENYNRESNIGGTFK